MWPIFIKILSIIGIVLACIIGVVLLLVLIILLAPIVYKVEGMAHDNKYFAKVRAHYLFGIIRAGYTYPEPGNLYAKAAWFTLYDSSASDDEGEADSTYKNSNNSGAGTEVKTNEIAKNADYSTEIKSNAIAENVDASTLKKEDEISESTGASSGENNKASSKKKTVLNPIYHIKKAWIRFRQKLVNKIKIIYKEASFYLKLIQHEDTLELWNIIKKRLIKILKQLAPKRGNANIVVGMDSPDTTAYIFGVYALLLNRWNKKIVLIPDFEKKIFDGEGYMKGWFCLGGILVQALPVILSKKLKLFRARIDRHKENIEKTKQKQERAVTKDLNNLEAEYE